MMKRFKLLAVVFALLAGFLFLACNSDEPTPDPESSVLPDFVPFDAYVSNKAPATEQTFRDINAVTLVSEIKLGWNLGNTLDAGFPTWYPNATLDQIETAWVSTKTSQATINAVKSAGFNGIRIPVSWGKVANSNHIIRQDWMDRVTEIVNYAVNQDMYIIINTHHDEDLFKFTSAKRVESITAFRIIWWQIANNFKNYGDKIIFEGLNEPRTKGSSKEWSGGTDAEHKILNEYYQHFVDVVRLSGGNNAKRMLMINTYAASIESVAINALKLPTDTVSNRLIVSVHSYSPYNFALNTNDTYNTWSISNSNDTSVINDIFNRVNNAFVSKGIPVIMGEFGAMYKNNDSYRVEWAKYYMEKAKAVGVPCFWWDNAHADLDKGGERFGLLDRSNNTFNMTIVNALKQGAGI